MNLLIWVKNVENSNVLSAEGTVHDQANRIVCSQAGCVHVPAALSCCLVPIGEAGIPLALSIPPPPRSLLNELEARISYIARPYILCSHSPARNCSVGCRPQSCTESLCICGYW